MKERERERKTVCPGGIEDRYSAMCCVCAIEL